MGAGKSIHHFPLESTCAITIHKSQKGTFNILSICNFNNDFTFYQGQRNDGSLVSLQEEFQRLSLNRLLTIYQ